MRKIVAIHLKNCSDVIKVTPEQAKEIIKLRNSDKKDNLVKIGVYHFPPSSVSYMKDISGEDYDLTGYKRKADYREIQSGKAKTRSEILEDEYGK